MGWAGGLARTQQYLSILNVGFQICLLFVPEMSASITSCIVQIIYTVSAWNLYPLHFSLLPLI
jgi:hypothetical protein